MQQGLNLGSRNRTVGEAGSSHSHLPTGSTHLLSDQGTPDLSGHHVPGQRGYSSFSTGFDFTLALKPLLDMLSTNDYAPGLNISIENYSNLNLYPCPVPLQEQEVQNLLFVCSLSCVSLSNIEPKS